MTKNEVQQRVLKDGKPLALDKFTWDEETNTFSSQERRLVIDFGNISNCIFNTSADCTFNTLSSCIFYAGQNCIFNTGSYCIFNTGSNCIFNTGTERTFTNIENFTGGSGCIFNTGFGCTFNTGRECVVIRRDIYEVIELKEGQKIKLNGFRVKGFVILN